jgi:phosphate starvation-inducible protein PhoH and related proteins
VKQTIDLNDNQTALALAGDHDANLKILERTLECRISQRGTLLTLEGESRNVEKAAAAVTELLNVIKSQRSLTPPMVESLMEIAVSTNGRPSDVYGDVVWSHRGRQIGPRTVNQKSYVDAIRANTITFGVGPAGTGKTYLATAMAVAALMAKSVGRIILTRPAVEAGESLGFLPGTVLEKVDPYFRPLFDALYDMMDAERLTLLMEKGEIEVAPLAFMRGRTLNDSFIILDEAQNTTPEQMKMFLTRLGFGSRMVVTGDITQIDLPGDRQSGLVTVTEVLADIPDIAFVNFDHRDVVRHKLVQRIVAAYKDASDRRLQEEQQDREREARGSGGHGFAGSDRRSGPRGDDREQRAR